MGIPKINKHGLPREWKHTLGLYLDISRKDTGYCAMLGDKLIHHGHRGFEGYDSDGEMLMEFYAWLQDLLSAGEYHLIGMEYAPFQRGRALELWHNLVAILKITAHTEDLKVLGVHPTQVKMATGARHNAKKHEVIRRVNDIHNLKLTNDNVADAIGVGMAAPNILDGDYRIKWL